MSTLARIKSTAPTVSVAFAQYVVGEMCHISFNVDEKSSINVKMNMANLQKLLNGCKCALAAYQADLISDVAEAIEVFGDDELERFAATNPRCSHGNILEECSQCDSDFQQEVRLDTRLADQVPIDDPDGGLDDTAYGYYPDTLDIDNN